MIIGGKNVWKNTTPSTFARIVLAHGAGAPADHPTLSAFSEALALRGLEVIRFEFQYMADRRTGGSKRPPPRIDKITDEWREWLARVEFEEVKPMFLAGKSMGGRAATLLNNENAKPSWQGVICFGYPFHPAGSPEKLRTEHLRSQGSPLHIIQGTRDSFGNREEVETYQLPPSIGMTWIDTGDHDLKPLKRSGINHQEALDQAASSAARFIRTTIQAT